MTLKETKEKLQRRILILCVDRDDDVGVKANVKTPLIGRIENLNAAVALALVDPEEADANAIFGAVRIYDRLQDERNLNESFQIATIAGSELNGVGSDRKLVAELNQLLGSFPADEVILVTDGYADEVILPIVESRIPVSSVRRIVVKHSESVEETAAVLTRYLKMLLENPRYSRIALGLPGLLILILGIFTILDLLYYYWIAFIFILSSLLVVKGFRIDKATKRIYRWIRDYSPPPLKMQISTFSKGAGLLSIIIGTYLGVTTVIPNFQFPSDLGGWLSILPQITAYFIQGSVNLIVVGVSLLLLGSAIRCYFERDVKLLRNATLIVSIIWLRQVLDATSKVLLNPGIQAVQETLIFSIIVEVLIGITSFLVAFAIYKSTNKFFKKNKDQTEEFGDVEG